MNQITYAGWSRVMGQLKFRTAVGPARIAQLARLGDTDINIQQLHQPALTRQQALAQVLEQLQTAPADVVVFLKSELAADTGPRVVVQQARRAKPAKPSKSTESPAREMTRAEREHHRRWWMNNVLRPVYEAN